MLDETEGCEHSSTSFEYDFGSFGWESAEISGWEVCNKCGYIIGDAELKLRVIETTIEKRDLTENLVYFKGA